MKEVSVRAWHEDDDPALVDILRRQLELDQAWPPPYAHKQNLAEWLARPANLSRWVAVNPQGRPIGHMGLGVPAASHGDIFSRAIDRANPAFAELCRTCIDPDYRDLGLASLLTRTAIKHAISLGRIPVSTVLTNRTGWLDMMRRTGWTEAGRLPGSSPDDHLICLLPPHRFIEAAINR